MRQSFRPGGAFGGRCWLRCGMSCRPEGQYMRKAIVTAALLSCAAIAVSPALANNSWGGYHWAGNGQDLAVKVNTSITGQWDTSVTGSISDWNASNELTLTRVVSSAGTKKCSPIAGQVLV